MVFFPLLFHSFSLSLGHSSKCKVVWAWKYSRIISNSGRRLEARKRAANGAFRTLICQSDFWRALPVEGLQRLGQRGGQLTPWTRGKRFPPSRPRKDYEPERAGPRARGPPQQVGTWIFIAGWFASIKSRKMAPTRAEMKAKKPNHTLSPVL
jgi:hypothetical protein